MRTALALPAWSARLARAPLTRRLATLAALVAALAALVAVAYGHPDHPAAAMTARQAASAGAGSAAARTANPPRHPTAPPAAPALRVWPRPADAAAAWYAARHALPPAQVRPLQQAQIGSDQVQVLVMAGGSPQRLTTALVTVHRVPGGWAAGGSARR
jgi:hypothetical protein